MINIPDVSSRYGAPMGRPSLIPSKEVAEVMRVSLRRIRIYRDGYAAGHTGALARRCTAPRTRTGS